MKRRQITAALLVTAVLSVGLTGCGDEGIEALEKRVTSGKDAGKAVEGLNELNREKSEEVDRLLEE